MKQPLLSPVPGRGFTLVEMMVVVAITGILLAVGVPQFQQFIAQRAMTSQISAFSSSLRLTRSEAIKRRRNVTMCRTTTPNDANPACAAANGDWTSGWIVFEDAAPFGQVDDGDTIIATHTPPSGKLQITSNVNFTMTFRSTGLAVPAMATFRFSIPGGSNLCGGGFREVAIASTGRTSQVSC